MKSCLLKKGRKNTLLIEIWQDLQVPFLVQKSGYDKQNFRVPMNRDDHAAPGHARQAQERFTGHGAACLPYSLLIAALRDHLPIGV
jgi:hypothetical protein